MWLIRGGGLIMVSLSLITEKDKWYLLSKTANTDELQVKTKQHRGRFCVLIPFPRLLGFPRCHALLYRSSGRIAAAGP